MVNRSRGVEHMKLVRNTWKRSNGPQTPQPQSRLLRRPPLRPQRQDHENFTEDDLDDALGKLRKNKAPGPDKVANELLLLMDPHTKTLLLGYFN